MTQDPNTRAQIEPTELGANAAESGERDMPSAEGRATPLPTARPRSPASASPRWLSRVTPRPGSTPTRRPC